jgi:hypothetical protein
MSAVASLALLALLAQPSGTSTLTYTLASTTAVAPEPDTLVVVGNQVLSAQVYRALVNLPENARLTHRTAERAERDILRFLRLAGYELAEVHVSLLGKQLIVQVDEGRLERVVFLGSTGLGTLRLQLMLDLPGRVFNRPDVEEQLERFRREEGLRITEYQIITVDTSTRSRPQVPRELGGLVLMPRAGRYELHVRMNEPDYPSGLGLELRGEPADGVVSAVRYRFAEVVMDGDRVEVAGVFGFRPQKLFVGDDDGQRWISRAGARLGWISPEVFEAPLRLWLGAEGGWGSRARLDLGVVRYDRLEATPSARLRLRPSRFVEIEAGGGVFIDRITSIVGGAFSADSATRFEPIAFLHGELSFGDSDVRLDRRHELELDVRQYFGPDTRARLSLTYEKSIGFELDDLVVSAGGAMVLGERPYYALERIGERVKGAYGDLLYGWMVGSAGLEYRLSLTRELLKVGFAYDMAVYARDLGERRSEPGVLGAVSVGLHALILDAFRFSLYGVAAWAVGETPEPGASVSLSQVF